MVFIFCVFWENKGNEYALLLHCIHSCFILYVFFFINEKWICNCNLLTYQWFESLFLHIYSVPLNVPNTILRTILGKYKLNNQTSEQRLYFSEKKKISNFDSRFQEIFCFSEKYNHCSLDSLFSLYLPKIVLVL